MIIFLRMRVVITSLLRDKLPPLSLSLCIFTVFVHFRSLIENCVLLYICVYGCIFDTFLLYYWISEISVYIALLYLHSHFVPKIILDFHLLGLGFWILFMIKTPLEPHCKIIFLRMRVADTSLLRDKLPPF